ncbi:MAG: hypothetical protein AAFR41_04260 [Pseudomonadota bacterium]
MRKWLTYLVLLLALVGALAYWLAGKANENKPDAGTVRLEIENVL